MPDIDECETNIYLCGANAICNNNMGSYNCSCSPGYFGNGQACLGNCQILTHWVLLHFFFVVMSIIVLRFFLQKGVKKKTKEIVFQRFGNVKTPLSRNGFKYCIHSFKFRVL